jgi:hypothetical protein
VLRKIRARCEGVDVATRGPDEPPPAMDFATRGPDEPSPPAMDVATRGPDEPPPAATKRRLDGRLEGLP